MPKARFIQGSDSDDTVWLDHEEIWLPISQIADESDDMVGIPRWLAEKKGLV